MHPHSQIALSNCLACFIACNKLLLIGFRLNRHAVNVVQASGAGDGLIRLWEVEEGKSGAQGLSQLGRPAGAGVCERSAHRQRAAALCSLAWARSPGWADGHEMALPGTAFCCTRFNSVISSASNCAPAVLYCPWNVKPYQ